MKAEIKKKKNHNTSGSRTHNKNRLGENYSENILRVATLKSEANIGFEPSDGGCKTK